MALDNAQFMSELSITDPPGTDPLSEGDDQIRTSKRTQLQSFPNVDAAVTLTAAQLNDAAIQGEANAFAGSQQFDHPMFLDAITQAADTVLFLRDSVPTGRWDVAFTAVDGGADFYIRRRDAAGASLDQPFIISAASGRVLLANATLFADGTAAAPGLSFSQQGDLGFYHEPLSSVIACATSGVERWRLSATSMTVTSTVILGSNGTVASPGYAFRGDVGTGMYRESASVLAFAAGGQRHLRVKTNTVSMDLPLSNAGLSTGDLFVSGGFVAIEP